MSYNISEAVLHMLKENYEKACNGYLVELLNMWDLSHKYGWWAGDEAGSTYFYEDAFSVSMDDIIYIVSNQIPYEEYLEWYEYTTWAIEFGQNVPNLKSWHLGCPRVDKETQKKIMDMKAEFDRLICETKEKF